MKKIFFYLIGLLLAVGCTEPIVSTFGSIGGTVQDAKDGSFIQGVTVMLNPTGYSQVTNADGAFQYDNLDIAEYTLTFTKDGYEDQKHKVTVKPGTVASVQITLKPASQSITVEPSVLDFGSDKSEMQMKLSSNSGSVLYSLKAQNDWISISKKSGFLTGSDYITVVVSRSQLSPSTYDGSILLTADTKEISIPVKMVVSEPGAPKVTIEAVSDVSTTKATVSGTIVELGDKGISKHGFCWSSTNKTPGLSDSVSDYGNVSKVKTFKGTLSGLKPATEYHVRAYVTSTSGTFYSDEVLSFTTGTVGGDDNNDEDSDSGSDSGSDNELVVPQGLMSYYTFDKGDGSDATENELDAILVNDPSFVSETVDGTGKALMLNGAKGQFMNIPYNVFKNLKKITVSFWIKDFSIGAIFSTISADYPRSDHPRLIADTDSKFRFYTGYDNYDTTPSFSYPYTSIQSGKWHHVVVSMDGDTRYLYVDGARTDSNTAPSWPSEQATGTKVYIGGNKDGEYKMDCITMKIDNIRFYQRCISDKEVKSIYDSEK